MDITNNNYVLFHTNYLASKREQIKLQQLIKSSKNELKEGIFTPSKLKTWRVENKKVNKYLPQDSKYNFKQIVKNFKLNIEQFKHGYSNKYINIFTNLLYEKNSGKYPKKRLSLVDYRKKILKKKLDTSFEEFALKEPLSERYNFSKLKTSNIYLTNIIKRLDKEKSKQKNSCLTTKKEKTKKYNNNRILLKDLLNESNSKDNKFALKLDSETFNNSNLAKIIFNNDKNNKVIYRNNLFTPRICNTSISESNIIIPINKNNGKIINYYNRQNDDEDKYFEKKNPKEEFIQKRNKAIYIDYLKNKYDFYSNKNKKDLKNYSEIKKRQLIFESGKDKIEHPLEFPYKKEFFKKFNRQYNNKIRIKELIKQDIKNDEFSTKYFTPKRKLLINDEIFHI